MSSVSLHSYGIVARLSRSAAILVSSLVLAVTACSQPSSDDKAITRTPATTTASSQPAVGDLYAVVVGISNYSNSKIPKLKVSDKDAKDFAAFLKTQAKLFKNVHLTLLLNEKATKRELETQLVYELRKAGRDDTVIVFLSGHGANDPRTPGEFFFLTHDSDPEVLAVTAVHMNRQWFVEKLESKRFVLIADACHGSGVIDQKIKAGPPSFQTMAQHFRESEGRVFITSSRADQYSKEMPERGNSLFTHFLLEGLSGKADENGDGIVTLKELYDYVYAKTIHASRGEQHPQWEARGMTGTFPVALYTPLPNTPVAVRAPVAALEPSQRLTQQKPTGAAPTPAKPVPSKASKDAALIAAAEQGRLDEVKRLVTEGADVKARDKVGYTALDWARAMGHRQIVELLGGHGAHNPEKDGLFLEAALRLDLPTMERLLSEGADINASKDGVTALALATYKRNIRVVQALLKRGADPNAIGKDGHTALFWAIEMGNMDLMNLLLKKGADINFKDKGGDTVLTWAARAGHWDNVRMLLKYGADVDAKDGSGWTPLMWAAEYNGLHEDRLIDVIQMLLKHGANVNARTKEGGTAWHAAKTDSLKRLLKEHGGTDDPSEYAALHKAAEAGNLDRVKQMLSEGADVNAKDEHSLTALHWAARTGNTDIVRLLLDQGADIKVKSDSHDRATALHYAAMNGHTKTVQLLLERGADIDAKEGSWGETARSLAKQWGFKKTERLLSEWQGRDKSK